MNVNMVSWRSLLTSRRNKRNRIGEHDFNYIILIFKIFSSKYEKNVYISSFWVISAWECVLLSLYFFCLCEVISWEKQTQHNKNKNKFMYNITSNKNIWNKKSYFTPSLNLNLIPRGNHSWQLGFYHSQQFSMQPLYVNVLLREKILDIFLELALFT